jgi:signal transduction histidine kinase
MKLRHQIALLLGLPIACQLLATGVLGLSLAKVDQSARTEWTAKQVVGLCQESLALVGESVMEITLPDFVPTRGQNRLPMLTADFAAKVKQLKELTQGNKQAETVVDKYDQHSKKLLQYINEASHSFDAREGKLVFSQFFEFGEYVESMKALLDQVRGDLNTLTGIYGPAAQEFQPAALQRRSALINWIALAISTNVGLVFFLALMVNRRTLSRLKILMMNMQAFSKGDQAFQSLTGNDELAELDHSFKTMADERNKLDEIRKSLLAMLTHDLRSPLTSISLGLELVLDVHGASIAQPVERVLKRMYSEVQRLTRLANTLLDVEKIEGGDLQVTVTDNSCADLFEPALAAVSSLADRRQIEIKGDLEEALVLKCDKDRTIQVVVNLLSNAIKFAPEKSKITVGCRTTANGQARLEVVDEGPGVPPEKVPSLFGKFKQLDQPSEVKKQGSGLGLYICKRLITAQGGTIGYASPGEKGSCFWFELPVTTAATVS